MVFGKPFNVSEHLLVELDEGSGSKSILEGIAGAIFLERSAPVRSVTFLAILVEIHPDRFSYHGVAESVIRSSIGLLFELLAEYFNHFQGCFQIFRFTAEGLLPAATKIDFDLEEREVIFA